MLFHSLASFLPHQTPPGLGFLLSSAWPLPSRISFDFRAELRVLFPSLDIDTLVLVTHPHLSNPFKCFLSIYYIAIDN